MPLRSPSFRSPSFRSPSVVGLCGALLCLAAIPVRAGEAVVGPIPEGVKLDSFYRKHVDAGGVPVVGSERVSDAALIAAAAVVERMLSARPPLRAALAARGARLALIGRDEATTDLPEYEGLRRRKAYWDRRARGFGGTPAQPMTSAGEENVLGLPADRYRGESVLIHEFAHAVHHIGLTELDEGFDDRLQTAFDAAIEAGRWAETYAATNPSEYFAEGVQCYFDCNAAADPPNGVHNAIRTREQLRDYDPALYELIDEAFGRNRWRWTPPGAHRQAWEDRERDDRDAAE
ncbi:hypothetical protein [Alienimonas sp. DA493]|uniref:hypothetical protein n=1 Tax=Alienimonas sp. DA493 TaxID=3373605 RepID=UPI003753FF93